MVGPSGQNGFGLSNLNGGANIAQNFTVPPPPPLHQCLKPRMSDWIVAARSSGMAKQMQRWIGGDVPVTRVKE